MSHNLIGTELICLTDMSNNWQYQLMSINENIPEGRDDIDISSYHCVIQEDWTYQYKAPERLL